REPPPPPPAWVAGRRAPPGGGVGAPPQEARSALNRPPAPPSPPAAHIRLGICRPANRVSGAPGAGAGSLPVVSRISVVGVPSSAASYAAGQDLAPAALRSAGLLEQLIASGLEVSAGRSRSSARRAAALGERR